MNSTTTWHLVNWVAVIHLRSSEGLGKSRGEGVKEEVRDSGDAEKIESPGHDAHITFEFPDIRAGKVTRL